MTETAWFFVGLLVGIACHKAYLRVRRAIRELRRSREPKPTVTPQQERADAMVVAYLRVHGECDAADIWLGMDDFTEGTYEPDKDRIQASLRRLQAAGAIERQPGKDRRGDWRYRLIARPDALVDVTPT